jgi:hypothetical protein
LMRREDIPLGVCVVRRLAVVGVARLTLAGLSPQPPKS